MRRATALRIVLILVGFLCIGAVCEVRIWSLKEQHREELCEEREGLELGVTFFAEDLAEHQAKAGHATYLIVGLPLADESRYGYPVLNLGCMTDSIKEVFVSAYDGRLESLAKKGEEQLAQPTRSTGAASRSDGRDADD